MATIINLKHSTTKTPGQKVFAVADWNADHTITSDIDIGTYNFSTRGYINIGEGHPDQSVNGVAISAGLVTAVDNVATKAGLAVAQFENSVATVGAVLYGARTRGTAASRLIVQDGDNLFDIVALGWDGTDYAISSRIDFEVDGTPGNDDMPGRILFKTSADGAQTPLERVRIDKDGNVGIGTTAPISLLSLQDNTAETNAINEIIKIEQMSTGSVAAGFGTAIDFGLEDDGGALKIGAGGIGAEWIDPAAAILHGALIFGTRDGDVNDFNDVGYEKMRITNTGNVGIGTISPGTKLDVYDATATQAIFSGWEDGGSSATAGKIQIGGHATDFGIIRYAADGELVIENTYDNINGEILFRTKTSGTPIDALSILGDGRVGIGTASPATSALLELSSTTGALLLSRMTTTQRDALTAVNGMVIYNTSTNAFNFYENGAWVSGSGLA